MLFKRILIPLLALLLSAGMLVSCTETPPIPPSGESESDAPVDSAPVEIPSVPDAEDAIAAYFADRVTPDEGAFDYAALLSGGVEITGYRGSAAHVEIPAYLGGKAVVSVGEGALAGHAEIKTLVLPDTVGSAAFGLLADCTSLEALSLPAIFGDADGNAFLGYLFGSTRFEDNARDVPATLKALRVTRATALPDYALYDCNDLELLSLADGTEKLGKFSLSRCEALLSIGGIGEVRDFGEYALFGCKSLESLTLSNAACIGFAALEGCEALRTLSVPFAGKTASENTYLGYIFGAAYPDFSRGYYPRRLARVEITGGTALGENAFLECKTLKEVVLPEGLLTVGVRAFYGCSALYTLTLPASVAEIREAAFSGCDSLLRAELGTSLTSLGINAFQNCDSLTEIVLPQTLKTLSASAFSGCTALERADLGGVTRVEKMAFRGCAALREAHAVGKIEIGEGNGFLESCLGK